MENSVNDSKKESMENSVNDSKKESMENSVNDSKKESMKNNVYEGMSESIKTDMKACEVYLCGVILTPFMYNHTYAGKHYYLVYVEVERLSGKADRIPVLVADSQTNIKAARVGMTVEVWGYIFSRNIYRGREKMFRLAVSVKAMSFPGVAMMPVNEIRIKGHVMKQPVFRNTPSGRELTNIDLMLSRFGMKSDYVPCICWGMAARWARHLPVGAEVEIRGRFQSRVFDKFVGQDTVIQRTVYEISINRIRPVHEKTHRISENIKQPAQIDDRMTESVRQLVKGVNDAADRAVPVSS